MKRLNLNYRLMNVQDVKDHQIPLRLHVMEIHVNVIQVILPAW